jgi:drug/metabolite transporter (DMT)-like permease
VVVTQRTACVGRFRSIGRAELIVAVGVAVASGCFIVALNHAPVANVLVVHATSPMIAVALAWLVLGESATRRTWAATIATLAGVVLMLGQPGDVTAVGAAASLVLAIAFAVAAVATRSRPDISMVPALCVSQLLVLAVAGPLADWHAMFGDDLLELVALGWGQIGLGLALFTIGARLIPAGEAALITLLEIVLGPLWVWIAISEQPNVTSLVGGAIVISAVAAHALAGQPAR